MRWTSSGEWRRERRWEARHRATRFVAQPGLPLLNLSTSACCSCCPCASAGRRWSEGWSRPRRRRSRCWARGRTRVRRCAGASPRRLPATPPLGTLTRTISPVPSPSPLVPPTQLKAKLLERGHELHDVRDALDCLQEVGLQVSASGQCRGGGRAGEGERSRQGRESTERPQRMGAPPVRPSGWQGPAFSFLN